MRFRRQLPAWSPITAGAIGAGLMAPRDVLAQATEAVRSHWGSGSALLTDSGTSALRVAFEAVRRGALLREEPLVVALPGWGCYDLATAAIGAGAQVALYDLDPRTLAPELDSVERVLQTGVKALVVVHPYGIPVTLAPLAALADRYGAVLIEDAAQSAGGSLHGRPLGSLGSLAVLSFGRGKGITAGRGGALLANDARGEALLAGSERGELLGLARGRTSWREPLALAAQWGLGRPALYGVPSSLPFLRLGETVYHPPGAVVRRLSPFAAGVLMRTLPMQPAEADRRRQTGARWVARVAAAGGTATPIIAGGLPGYLRFPVLVRREVTRRDRSLGIERGYPIPLAELAPLRPFLRLTEGGEGPPGARLLARHLATLPTHGRLTEGDTQRLEYWLGSCFSPMDWPSTSGGEPSDVTQMALEAESDD